MLSSMSCIVFLGFDLCRCFPHVVNLACKAVLAAITHMDLAKEGALDYTPDGPELATIQVAISRDPIATIRSLVRTVGISETS